MSLNKTKITGSNKIYVTRYLTLIIIFAGYFCAGYSEPAPRWVKKGVVELDKKRSNNTYSFHIFHQEDIDNRHYSFNRFKPLLDYVDSTYHVSSEQIYVDSIMADGVLPTTYTLTFEKDGRKQQMQAIRVDQYSKFEDYADNTFEYNLYQLYAISEPNVTPQFDEFILTRKYNGNPVAMSIIPGLGQIYKGEPAKGYSFMGIEAVMIAGIIYTSNRANLYDHLAATAPEYAHDSYKSRATSFKQWRAFCCIAGGALYIYNLFDAAFAKGARYVEIKRKNNPNAEMTFSPFVSPDMLGVGINLNF